MLARQALGIPDPVRLQQQQDADRPVVILKKIAVTRIAWRNGTLALATKAPHPIGARSAWKTSGQQLCNRVDIALGDLPALNFGYAHRC
jgi:hypothetical protein